MLHDEKKRQLILGTAAAAAMAALPKQGVANPVVAAAIVGSVIAGLASLVRGRQELENSLAVEREKWRLNFINNYLARLPVEEQLAYYRANNSAVSWRLTDNVDRRGTELGLSDGRIGVIRGDNSGTFTSYEAGIFANAIIPIRGRMPMPMEVYLPIESQKEKYRLLTVISKHTEKDVVDLDEQIVLVGRRRYSTAETPTKAGADIEMIATINKKTLGDLNYQEKPKVKFFINV